MKKLLSKWNIRKHFIFSLLLTVIIKVISLFTVGNEITSIGIIGGADGPTSVFLASNINGFIFENIVILFIFVTMLITYIPIKYIRERYDKN